MPARLDVSGLGLRVHAEPLTVPAFAPFGDVIENPRPDVQPGQYGDAFPGSAAPPFHPVSANQGSAIKYQHVSRLADRYAADGAPSGQPSAAVANVFVCAARTLVEDSESGTKETGTGTGAGTRAGTGLFPVTILERHPYTTQTFVPLNGHGDTRYLVIVAPTLASDNDRRGPPDIHGLRAFVARGDQAVTYGAGTWHAPMAALGTAGTSVAYAVFQFANGVGPEDCQETVLDGGSRAQQQPWTAVTVRVERGSGSGSGCGCAAKL